MIYYFINTSTPCRRSKKIWHTKIHAYLNVLSRGMRPFTRWKVISCQYDVIFTPPFWFTNILGIFKTTHTNEVHHRNLCQSENGDVRRKRGAHISHEVYFPSGLTPIDTYCQLKSTERYKNVSRALAYTWNGRFRDGSTDNTSRRRPKYKNCRIKKPMPDAIDCD